MAPKADIVVDFAFGDAGKGATVDFLARERKPDVVIRFGGGAQCAHNVVAPDGTHHCFHLFGSALLAHPDPPTFLSHRVLFDPFLAMQEQEELAKLGIDAKLFVHPSALVVTPWHVAMNRLREIVRRGGRHGSCGMGIGEVRADQAESRPVLYAGDLTGPGLRKRLRAILDLKVQAARDLFRDNDPPPRTDQMAEMLLNPTFHEAVLDNLTDLYPSLYKTLYDFRTEDDFRDSDYLIFEGHQGVLLDEWIGFFPHVTRTDTTSRNATKLLSYMDWRGDTELFGVLRAFGTRHGAGPFPTEDTDTQSWALEGEHNALGPWQGTFRTGWFDMPLARYAIRANGMKPDKLVLTCLDRFPKNAGYLVERYEEGEAGLLVPSQDLPEHQALEHASANTEFLRSVRPQRVCTHTPEETSDSIRERLGLPDGWDSYSAQSLPESKIMKGP